MADPDNTIVLSRDLSPWETEHFFAADRRVPDEEMTTLSGDYITRVFEGPYARAREWHAEMQDLAQGGDGEPGRVYFYYTTCPKCAKAYGRNFVVGLAEVMAEVSRGLCPRSPATGGRSSLKAFHWKVSGRASPRDI